MNKKEIKRYYVTNDYGDCLDVSTSETDLSQRVKCYCHDTEEVIYVNGWNVEWEEWEEAEEYLRRCWK